MKEEQKIISQHGGRLTEQREFSKILHLISTLNIIMNTPEEDINRGNNTLYLD